MDTVIFDGEDGQEIELGIMQETTINGINYLLVIDPEENDENGAAAYILKDVSEGGAKGESYEFVENDKEYNRIYKRFAEMMSDISFEE